MRTFARITLVVPNLEIQFYKATAINQPILSKMAAKMAHVAEKEDEGRNDVPWNEMDETDGPVRDRYI